MWLGAGESGKSTVLKQMRLMHSDGFTRAERKQWRVVIFNNLIHAFQVIFAAMQELEQEFTNSANLVRVDWVLFDCLMCKFAPEWLMFAFAMLEKR